jgi:hypothetical protein
MDRRRLVSSIRAWVVVVLEIVVLEALVEVGVEGLIGQAVKIPFVPKREKSGMMWRAWLMAG